MAVRAQAIPWTPPEPWGELQPHDDRDWRMYWLGSHHGEIRCQDSHGSVWGLLLLMALCLIVGGIAVELLHWLARMP